MERYPARKEGYTPMDDTQRSQEAALARFAVIAPLVSRTLSPAQAAAIRQAILGAEHVFPQERPRRITERTLRRWVAAYKKALPGGTIAALNALYPQPRSDRGVPRVFDPQVIEDAIALRKELATRSTEALLAHLEDAPKGPTLAYHLRKRGATRALLKAQSRAYPRYEAPGPNVTWQSDVKDGFFLPDPTDPTKFKEAHLMGFLDDHSRLIAHGEWYFKEALPCLLDCLKKAVLKHGISSKLYWDNGPIYKSRQVSLIAARLGCQIIFSTPYAPEGKGKIERFWRTTADAFMNEAAHAGFQTLDELNQAFWAWVEQYNQKIHSSTKMAPKIRWEADAEAVRYPHPADVHDLFLWEDRRVVKKTGTLSLAGNEYQVSESLIGQRVEVRYDPLDLATVKVFRGGDFVEVAVPYRLVAHTHRKATPRPKDEKYLPLPSSKRLLQMSIARRAQSVDTEIAQVTGSGEREGRLTLPGWNALVAEMLGREVAEAERAELATFFKRYAPLPAPAVGETLRTIVERKGADRHLSYYLGEIAQCRMGVDQ